MMDYYLQSGYLLKSLTKYMLEASKFTQNDLLQVKTKSPIDTPVMVTTYNSNNPNIKGFIHRNWNIIEHSNDCSSTFQQKTSNRIQKTIKSKNLLTKAKIAYTQLYRSHLTFNLQYATDSVNALIAH